MKSITLYYRQGSSDKQYTVTLEGSGDQWLVNTHFGRRGSAQQSGTKTPTAASLSVAEAIYERLVKEKMAKGYTPGEDGTPYAHTPHAEHDSGVRPQLLNPIGHDEIEQLLADEQWWMQQKHDGRRLLVKKDGSTITGINRRGLTVTLAQPLIDDASRYNGSFILDGEDMGDHYLVFDLLQMNEQDLRPVSYLERFLMLMSLFGKWERQHIRIVQSACVEVEKRRKFSELEAAGAEGVVFKKIDEPYSVGSPASGGPALKYKFQETASFVVSRVNDKRSVNLVLMNGGVARNAGKVTIPPNHVVPEVGVVVLQGIW